MSNDLGLKTQAFFFWQMVKMKGEHIMNATKRSGKFPWEEATLGEEIIALGKRGIDTPTVERMYRKYIEMTAHKEAKSDLKDAEVGDKTTIKLDGLGEFTATVHKVTDDKVMLIFDDYVTKRPMNESNTNNGGFEASDLNKWLHTEFIKALPYSIRARLIDVTIPTVGEMFGWDDEWDRNHFEADNDKQLPLMKQRRNRVAYYDNECEFGWLRNATKKEFSSADFALVGDSGYTNFYAASYSFGVRPEIWLVK